METFNEIYERACELQGGQTELEQKLPTPVSANKLKKIADDRWLSQMSKSIFQAGFVWRVVDNKWSDFEQLFKQFDLYHCAYLSDDDIAQLVTDTRVIRHLKKLQSIRHNASFLLEVAESNKSVGNYFASYGSSGYIQLLLDLKKRASRLGGNSAQYFLRTMGVDSFILTRDVVSALIRANIVTKMPTSKRDLENVQKAFDHWREESGRSLTEISRTLAMSIG